MDDERPYVDAVLTPNASHARARAHMNIKFNVFAENTRRLEYSRTISSQYHQKARKPVSQFGEVYLRK